MASQHIVTLSDETFDDQVRQLRGPVLVDFWASWCGPCRMIAPILDEVADELAGQATVAKINVDENGDTANRFGVRSIPTLLVLKEGKVVDQAVGALPKEQVVELLMKHVG